MNLLSDQELDDAFCDGYDWTPDEGPDNAGALRSVQKAIVARVVEMAREKAGPEPQAGQVDLRYLKGWYRGLTVLADQLDGKDA